MTLAVSISLAGQMVGTGGIGLAAYPPDAVLVMDFETNVYGVSGSVTALASLLGLTRSTVGIYVDSTGNLQSAPVDQPRFDWTTGRRSLLVEPAATRINSYPGFGSAGWTAQSATQTALGELALGVFPGVRVAGTGNDWNRTAQNIAVTNGMTYAIQAYARSGSGRLRIDLRNTGNSNTSRAIGTFGAVATSVAAAGTLTVLGQVLQSDGQIYKIDLAYTANFTGTLQVGFGPDSNTAGHYVDLFGVQIEAGAQPSSITIASLTRAADVASITPVLGATDLAVTYGDGSAASFSAAALDGDYWPPLTQTRVRSIIGTLP